MTTVGQSGWARPEPESVIGFVILFFFFTLAGYVVHAHIRAGRLHWLKTGIVGLLFTIAILQGFAVGLWVVDRLGLHDPYASGPRPIAETQTDRIVQPTGADMDPTFTVDRPLPESTRPALD